MFHSTRRPRRPWERLIGTGNVSYFIPTTYLTEDSTNYLDIEIYIDA